MKYARGISFKKTFKIFCHGIDEYNIFANFRNCKNLHQISLINSAVNFQGNRFDSVLLPTTILTIELQLICITNLSGLSTCKKLTENSLF